MKAVLEGRFVTVNAHIKKEKRFQINNIIYTLRNYKKSNYIHSKTVIKIKAEVEHKE